MTPDEANGICSICRDPPDECAGKCTNVFFDSKNCGSCGHACDPNLVCDEAECLPCVTAPDLCGQKCTDLKVDALNCGSCGNYCGFDKYCFQGTCTPCTAAAPVRCDDFGQCTDTQSDSRNCGGCHQGCRLGEKCVNGKCDGCFEEELRIGDDDRLRAAEDLRPPEFIGTCFASCPDATPDACGAALCVNFKTDPANCGGCKNSCPSGVCDQGVCTPGQCGTFKASEWDGSVIESSTDLCGGTASLSLDGSVDSIFHLTPSASVSGGCDVSGGLHLVQGGDICGVWEGLWNCGGTVAADGTMSLGCSCNTSMGAGGSFAGDSYTGGWSFDAGGNDENGDHVTDTGSGAFTLDRAP